MILKQDRDSNIIRNKRTELEQFGFKRLNPTDEILSLDLISLLDGNQYPDMDLWAEFQSEDEVKRFKKAMKSPFVGNLIIYRHETN